MGRKGLRLCFAKTLLLARAIKFIAGTFHWIPLPRAVFVVDMRRDGIVLFDQYRVFGGEGGAGRQGDVMRLHMGTAVVPGLVVGGGGSDGVGVGGWCVLFGVGGERYVLFGTQRRMWVPQLKEGLLQHDWVDGVKVVSKLIGQWQGGVGRRWFFQGRKQLFGGKGSGEGREGRAQLPQEQEEDDRRQRRGRQHDR